jgi:Protein of unknown function (DUF3619)
MNDESLPVWTEQAKQALDESAVGLDAATLSRLNRARQKALETRSRRFRPWFVPAGVASACAVMLAVAVVWHQRMPIPAAAGTAFTIGTPGAQGNSGFSGNDLDLVSGDDDIELYQDLDFYAWLDAQNPDSNG